MNIKKLKIAEKNFLCAYPGGFAHPEMLAMGKKHNVNKLSEFCQTVLAKDKFNQRDELLDNWVKVISRSSMISLFEKPKFRSFVNVQMGAERTALAESLYEILHGNAYKGFELQVELLKRDKIAKWSLISAAPAYYRLQDEVFIKPTTAKGVITHFELEGLNYKPTPNWDFYQRYRDALLEMKKHVDPALAPSNPAFSGFLMMAMPKKD